MGKPTQKTWPVALALVILLGLASGWGCTGTLQGLVGYDYFAAPQRNDPWSRKISYWQARERADRRGGTSPAAAPAAVAEAGEGNPIAAGAESLQAKYDAFRAERKRSMARELAEWIQEQAREHYIPDGLVDDWATLDETLRNNGDDCDGLELLVFNHLRELGFGNDEVYRAIVYRRTDGQHHMVTLWFENPNDPWVIDPTGAMTSGMPLMSELPEWVPLKVFSQDEDFSVQTRRLAGRLP